MISDFFKYFKKKENSKVSLYGRDLEKWNYLGFSSLSHSYYSGQAHLFVLKDNDKIRDYYIETTHLRYIKDDPWILNLHLWKGNQIPHRFAIKTWPSVFMINLAYDEGYTFDYDQKKWLISNKNEGNVVSVDFNKK